MIKNKHAAMEMSVGTIVTIVLLMAVLILGLTLTRGIFSSSKGAIDMTDAQLKKEIQGIFSDTDSKVVIIPTNQFLEIKQGKIDEIGVGITNRLSGSSASQAEFSYEATPNEEDLTDCGISEATLLSWISREKESGINIPAGSTYEGRIRFQIPENAPLCVIGFRLEVFVDPADGAEEIYETPITFDVQIK